MTLRLDRLGPYRFTDLTSLQSFYDAKLTIWWQKTAKAVEDHETIQDGIIENLQTTDSTLTLATEELEDLTADLAETVADLAGTQSDVGGLDSSVSDLDARVTDLESGAGNLVAKNTTDLWTAPTGTISRAAYAVYAGQTVSNPPTQAEMQALDDAVKALSQSYGATLTDLTGVTDVFKV